MSDIDRNTFTFIDTFSGPKTTHELCGWGGVSYPDMLREAFDQIGFPALHIIGAKPIKDGSRSMLWEVSRKILGSDTPNYPQEIGDPFIAGTKVLMADGSEKNIEDIQIGELVVNHKNETARVTNVIKKKFTGNLVTIKVKGWHRTLTATETHTGLHLPYEGYRFKYQGFEAKKFGEYEVGDYVHLSFGLNTNDCYILDIKDHVKDCKYDDKFVWKNNSKKIHRYIAVDSTFARFIGLYLAEGGCDGNRVDLSFNSNEVILHEETQEYIKSIFGLDSSLLHPKESCTVVRCNSVVVSEFIKSLIPGDLYNKSIPKYFFRCSKTIKLSLLRGWLDGDGYISKKYNRLIGVSSSKQLISDIARLSLSCNINPRTLIRKKANHQRVPALQVDIYSNDCSTVYDKWQEKQKSKILKISKTPYGFARKIKNIDYEYVVDREVYCITTEGEYTIVTNGIAQSNCVSFGAKNAVEYVQMYPLANGERIVWKRVFPPYLYGCGRVFIGKGQIGANEDGSLGVWQAKAVMEYGVIPIDAPNCPPYSGNVAKQWGGSGPPKDFVPVGKEHLIKSAASVKSWNDVLTALTNGYPVTIASNVGFDMEAQRDGFHHNTTSWGHQMCATPYSLTSYVKPRCIKDIKVGDEVFGHDGKPHYVTETFKRPYKGKILVIKTSGNLPLELTPNHPVMVIREDNDDIQEFRTQSDISILTSVKTKRKVWVNAGNLVKGDLVVCPKPDLSSIFYKTIIPEWELCPRSCLQPLFSHKELAWLFGLYIADGDSTKNHKITIKLAIHEETEAIRAKKAISLLGINSTIKIKENYIKVTAYSATLANSFYKWFGKKTDKKIPEWLFSWNMLEDVIDGIYAGDGNVPTGSPEGRRIVNTSRILIDQIRSILLHLGYKPSIGQHIYKNSNWNTRYYIEWYPKTEKTQINKWLDNDYIMKIRSIEEKDYEGDVYNFEVEGTHSYILEGIVTHNCIIGADAGDDKVEPHACILNSWGDAHGAIKDFRTGETWPKGTLRVRQKDIEKILGEGDSFAYSSFDGFPAQELSRDFFNFIE